VGAVAVRGLLLAIRLYSRGRELSRTIALIVAGAFAAIAVGAVILLGAIYHTAEPAQTQESAMFMSLAAPQMFMS
jgi:hypothetical protein